MYMIRLSNKHMKTMKGTAIAYALAIMTVVMILLTSILNFIASQLQYSFKQNDREQALQIAEAGIHFYKWYLAHQLDGRTASQVNAFWTSTSPAPLGVGSTYTGSFANGEYSILVEKPDPSDTIVYIESTGWTTATSGLKRKIKVRLRRPSWSENAVMSNMAVRFGVGTEVFGPIHSNNGIRFDGLAHNLVTSSVDEYNDPDHSDNNEEFGVHTHINVPPATGMNNSFRPAEASPNAVSDRTDVFEAGREFPVAPVDFNGVLGDLSLMKSEAQAGTNGSLYFNNDNQGRHIILNGTSFTIQTVKSFISSTNMINKYDGGVTSYDIPDNGIIFVENNVWLEGAVNGRRVTIVAANLISESQKTMYLGKDVRYGSIDCDNMIGLIGQKDVEIYRESNNILRIDASLLAQTGRVGRASYTGTSAMRDTITIYGAIASNKRYGFSWVDNEGNHVSGYATRNLYYDNNLLYCPPPYFPTGSQYTLDLWEEL